MIKYKMLLIISSSIILSFGIQNKQTVSIQNKNIKYPVQQNNTQLPQKEEGIDVYRQHCMTCHQINGSGVPNMYPPLQKSDWVIGDKNRIVSVILNGLQGEIEVNEETFRSAMPKQDKLTDEQIAKVLTYIRQSFGNNASAVKPAEVAKLRVPKTK